MAYRSLRYALVMAALVARAGVAEAEPTEANRAAARALMADGRALRGMNDLAGALAKFQAADSLLHFPTTALEVARAEAELGRLVVARDTLRGIRLEGEPGDPPPFQRARQAAREMLLSIEGRIPTVRVMVTGGGDEPVVVTVDDHPPPGGAEEPWPLDPGRHEVIASSATGHRTAEVVLAEGETKIVSLDLPRPPIAPTPSREGLAPGPPLDAPVALPPAPPPPAPAPPPRRTLAFVGFGAAGAAAISGAVTGALSIAETRAAENGCVEGACPPNTHTDLRAAHALALASDVSFAAAVVGIGVGVVGLRYHPRTEDHSRSVSVRPWVGFGAGGARGEF